MAGTKTRSSLPFCGPKAAKTWAVGCPCLKSGCEAWSLEQLPASPTLTYSHIHRKPLWTLGRVGPPRTSLDGLALRWRPFLGSSGLFCPVFLCLRP